LQIDWDSLSIDIVRQGQHRNIIVMQGQSLEKYYETGVNNWIFLDRDSIEL
jgi:hypothetical protein